jgi:hypothetical protein
MNVHHALQDLAKDKSNARLGKIFGANDHVKQFSADDIVKNQVRTFKIILLSMFESRFAFVIVKFNHVFVVQICVGLKLFVEGFDFVEVEDLDSENLGTRDTFVNSSEATFT